MIRKRLVLASYPLGYLGLALFLRWVVWLHYNSGIDNNLTKILLVLGSLVLLMLVSFGIGSSYFEIMFESFPKEVQRKCKVFFSYLDRVSLILFVCWIWHIYSFRRDCLRSTNKDFAIFRSRFLYQLKRSHFVVYA